MSLVIPCSVCAGRLPGKLANATWAWYRADQERVAYRQRLCVACYVANVAVLETATRDDPLNCPACHTDAGADMDPCYLTVYVPGVGKLTLEMATCGVCAVEIRNRAQVGAVQLENRGPVFGGQDPGPQTALIPDAWAQLGILPRE